MPESRKSQKDFRDAQKCEHRQAFLTLEKICDHRYEIVDATCNGRGVIIEYHQCKLCKNVYTEEVMMKKQRLPGPWTEPEQ